MHSEFLHTGNSERQILRIGSTDWISGRVAATRCQKLTGGMPPVPPALTDTLPIIKSVFQSVATSDSEPFFKFTAEKFYVKNC